MDRPGAEYAAGLRSKNDAKFAQLMKLAGDLRGSNPAFGSAVDRYAQGLNVRSQPGFNKWIDVPVNAALAGGYEAVKALPESIGNPILSAAGYERKTSGSQPTAPASLDNILALLHGMTDE